MRRPRSPRSRSPARCVVWKVQVWTELWLGLLPRVASSATHSTTLPWTRPRSPRAAPPAGRANERPSVSKFEDPVRPGSQTKPKISRVPPSSPVASLLLLPAVAVVSPLLSPHSSSPQRKRGPDSVRPRRLGPEGGEKPAG
jgi:hypothetical protein